MKIILLQDITKIGKKYEIKNVSDGHALNLLIPQGKAISATPDAIKKIEALKNKIDGERKIQNDLLEKNLDLLASSTLEVKLKANEKGHLFAGIHKKELIELIKKEKGIDIDSDTIILTKPIKEIGEHKIEVRVGDKTSGFILRIEKA